MPLIFEDSVDRIEFDEGEWIDIRSRLSYKVVSGFMTQKAKVKDDTIKILKVMIIAWNLKDQSGEIAEISDATIEIMDAEQMTTLIEEVNKRVPLLVGATSTSSS